MKVIHLIHKLNAYGQFWVLYFRVVRVYPGSIWFRY
jgi:hypothetical protein